MTAIAESIYLTEYKGPDGEIYAGPNILATNETDAAKKIESLEWEMLGLGFEWFFRDLEVKGKLTEKIK